MWLLTGVDALVSREIAFAGESFLASITREGFVTTVDAFVPGEIAAHRKLRRTFRTEVWLLTSVGSFVS